MSAGWSGEGAPSAPEPWLTDPPHQAKVFTLAGFVAGPNRPAHQVGQAKERVMKMNGEHQIAKFVSGAGAEGGAGADGEEPGGERGGEGRVGPQGDPRHRQGRQGGQGDHEREGCCQTFSP